MSRSGTVAVYFVASPLQYLAARRIAGNFEAGSRQVLVWYKPGLDAVVDPREWDACSYMAWPRLEPLPGPFGRHRRLRANIGLVAGLVGPCDRLVLHSAVYDTEAINYFLRALPAACGAREMRARILPDGVISIRRYPLSPLKRVLQCARKLRRLFAPELDYQCFGGDRIGSDAPFCDRIYVLPGLPNEYPPHKVRVLPPLVDARVRDEPAPGARRALVIGQPLTPFRLMSAADLAETTERMRRWLAGEGIASIDYKAHPKDDARELGHPDYLVIEPAGALESHMAQTPYDVVIGVRSSSLLLARQIYPPRVRVVAFGWERVRFKSEQEREDMRRAFTACGVEFA
ncbi:MAG: hypothetical protein KF822_12370 [Steroidobacteraceae bacterium]|jgi:hypothetical protein|nr:hypothetical protein [Steroidobacteraceae bacterium]